MRKGIADLHRRAEVSRACNDRYFDALATLATLDTDETLSDIIPAVCQTSAIHNFILKLTAMEKTPSNVLNSGAVKIICRIIIKNFYFD